MMWKKAVVLACALVAAGGIAGCGGASGSASPAKSESPQPAKEKDGNRKSLVVYFSATGHTKRAAEVIAKTRGADLWEIKPKDPYTPKDLDYNDDTSRVSREHKDKSLLPEIDGDVPAWDSYQTVFLGYPIWWGEAPNIVYHFVKTHDFSGKQIIPFCTSYSSDLGDSDVLLEEAAKSGEWLPGTRFSGGVSEGDLIDWTKHF